MGYADIRTIVAFGFHPAIRYSCTALQKLGGCVTLVVFHDRNRMGAALEREKERFSLYVAAALDKRRDLLARGCSLLCHAVAFKTVRTDGSYGTYLSKTEQNASWPFHCVESWTLE